MPDEKEKCKPLTKAQEIRKTTKPLMEKRRRARINASLTELKALLLDVMKKEGARTNKMEKADILEMTVKHLRTVQRQQFEVAAARDPTTFGKYNCGFNECATEVSRYLNHVDGINADLKTRLLNHLANCVTSIDCAAGAAGVSGARGAGAPPVTAHVRPMHVHPAGQSASAGPGGIKPSAAALPIVTIPEINNNVIPAMHGLTVAGHLHNTPPGGPAASQHQGHDNRLNGADLAAFVIPSNILSGGQMPGYIIPLYSGQAAAGKVLKREGDENDLGRCSPIVPEPEKETLSPPRPDSPDSDLHGMDLTTHRQRAVDSSASEESSADESVEDDAHAREDVRLRLGVSESARRAPPAVSEPMWRPW